MFYAVRIENNPNHQRYKRPIELIVEGDYDDLVPIERETEKEIWEELKVYGLYEAGWIKIIEID